MTATAQPERSMIAWVGLALRPICRFCMRNGVRLNDLYELLKVVLSDISREELQKSGHEVSASRISVMSGVHRKDVARIEAGAPRAQRRSKNMIANIMGQWRYDPEFYTRPGEARALETQGRNGEFSRLVRKVTGGNINPYAVLFEMERAGIVVREGDRAKLVWRDYVVSTDVEAALSLLAADIEGLVEGVNENIFEKPLIPNLHLTTSYDNVAASALPTIRDWLLREGSDFHRRIRDYVSTHDADINTSGAGQPTGAKVTVTSFSITASPSHPDEMAKKREAVKE